MERPPCREFCRVVSRRPAIVSQKDNDRVVGELPFFEVMQKFAARLVKPFARRQVPSASSSLNPWVESREFQACVVDFELPIDASLFCRSLLGPRCDLGLQYLQFADPAAS